MYLLKKKKQKPTKELNSISENTYLTQKNIHSKGRREQQKMSNSENQQQNGGYKSNHIDNNIDCGWIIHSNENSEIVILNEKQDPTLHCQQSQTLKAQVY